MVADDGIWVVSKIIQKVVHTSGSIGGGNKLIRINFTDTDDDGVVDGYVIV